MSQVLSQGSELVGKGMDFAGNTGAAVHRDLGQTLAIQGVASTAGTYSGNNLKTETDPDTGAINLLMADNPEFVSVTTGNTTLTTNGLTIVGGPSVTAAGIDAGGKVISNVANGTAPTDAANMSQVGAVSDKVDALNAGAVKYDTHPDGTIDYNSIVLSGTAYDPATKTGGTKITNVARGENDSDAVNMSQLNETNESISAVSDAVAGFAGDQSEGYTIANGRGIRYVRTNDAGLDEEDAYAQGEGSTAVGYQARAEGSNSIALGRDAFASAANSVALGANSVTVTNLSAPAFNPGKGTLAGATAVGEVSVGSAGAERRITNVAAGAADTDAVNVSQLKAVESAASAGWNLQANGGASGSGNVASGGSLNVVNGSNTSVNFDSATNSLTVNVVDNPTFSGEVTANGGLTVNDHLTVGSGTSVDMGGNQIHNVAAGTAPTDAVNVSQLADAIGTATEQTVKYDLNPDGTVNYDKVVMQGNGGTTISNVAAGEVSASSTDALNGSQLYQTNQSVANVTNTVNNLVGDQSAAYTEANGTGIKYVRTNETGLPASDASAQGQGSTAVGYDATASGESALALGRNAVATQANSVALGSNSVTAAAVGTASGVVGGTTYQYAGGTPHSTVSVGSAGNERTVTNVAAGRVSADSTDAVNGSQLYATNEKVNENTQDIANINQQVGANTQSIGSLSGRIESVRRDSNAGTASAMAVAGLPQAVLPGRGMMAIAGGTYGGQSAIAIGVSKLSQTGKWVFKGGVTSNTRGNYGATVGAGFHW